MKLDIDISGLINQRKSIGAPLTLWRPVSPEKRVLWLKRQDLQNGEEVGIDEIRAGPDNVLVNNDGQVLVYIKDTKETRANLRERPGKKFHVVECEHLRRMKREKKYGIRYVMTDRKDGWFNVVWEERNTTPSKGVIQARLLVCQYCLDELEWKGFKYANMDYSERANRVREFSIEEFFDKYSSKFDSKLRMDYEVSAGDRYPEDWPSISERVRTEKSWTCEVCGVCLEKRRQYCQVHHINGVRQECGDDNLQVLCRECHALQPGHGHMEISDDVRREIEGMRIKQGISRSK